MLAELQPLTEMLDAFFKEAEQLLQGLNKEQLNRRPLQGETREEITSSLFRSTAWRCPYLSWQCAARQMPADELWSASQK
jgi:hypothetical protein